ncbi:MAG: 50S ribosomal protein L11 methyltransferase [Fimbriimonadaceae bacterium]
MSNWIEIKACFETAPPDWSLFVDAFDRFGCPGSIQCDSPPALSAYLVEVPGQAERARELSDELIRLGAQTVQIETVPDEDWSEMWKVHFKPRQIGARIMIRPTWEDPTPVPLQNIEIVLDPGQAFGTGDHPTTRLCLELMQEIPIQGASVYDLGCGSGILAIAACKLGAASVFASDSDATSVIVSRQNSLLNEVNFEAEQGEGFLRNEPYDVVLSNIISATLIRLAPDAQQQVKRGGFWLVSGIIEGNWPDVRKAAEQCGFTLEKQLKEDEWIGAVFRL